MFPNTSSVCLCVLIMSVKIFQILSGHSGKDFEINYWGREQKHGTGCEVIILQCLPSGVDQDLKFGPLQASLRE